MRERMGQAPVRSLSTEEKQGGLELVPREKLAMVVVVVLVECQLKRGRKKEEEVKSTGAFVVL